MTDKLFENKAYVNKYTLNGNIEIDMLKIVSNLTGLS